MTRNAIVLICSTEQQAEEYEQSAREFMPESVRVERVEVDAIRDRSDT